MHRLLVRDVMSSTAVRVAPGATLAEVVAASLESRLTTIPVVDDDGVLYGVITFAELRLALLDRGELAPLLLAADLTEPTELALATDTVQMALSKLNRAPPIFSRWSRARSIRAFSACSRETTFSRRTSASSMHEV